MENRVALTVAFALVAVAVRWAVSLNQYSGLCELPVQTVTLFRIAASIL